MSAKSALALEWLNKAIALHERHMSGAAPTTGAAGEKSQQLMMDQMIKARDALDGTTDQGMAAMNSGLSEAELAVCKATGIAPAEFAKNKPTPT